MSTPVLKAAYSGPGHEPFTESRALPPLPAAPATSTPASVAAKTAYLAALRAAIAEVQGDINRELTARMVLDAQAASADKAAKDEEAAEANYGEEVMEED